MDQTFPHFCASPAAGIAFYDDLAAFHLTAHVSSGITVNGHSTAGHMSAQPVNSCQITLEMQLLITGVTGNREHFFQKRFAVAVKNFETLDFGERFIAGPVGSEPFNFNRNGCLPVVVKCKCHESDRFAKLHPVRGVRPVLNHVH